MLFLAKDFLFCEKEKQSTLQVIQRRILSIHGSKLRLSGRFDTIIIHKTTKKCSDKSPQAYFF